MTAHPIHRRQYRLLIAEDDQALRETLVALMRAEGYEIVAVMNGVELVKVLSASLAPASDVAEFDLVISEVRMPGLSGWRAFTRLYDGSRAPPPAVFLAEFGDELPGELTRGGSLVRLEKPIDIDELRTVVAATLAKEAQGELR